MPKVIEKVREQLLEEVKKQIIEHGYSKTTIRSVANACNLGVGTVYNYFPSKDMLIATVVAQDWFLCLERFKNATPQNSKDAIKLMYDELKTFEEKHKALFTDPDATKKYSLVFTEKHSILRGQIASFLLPVCQKPKNKGQENKHENPKFLAQFIAESLLTWVTEGVSFEELNCIIEKLL